MNKNKKILPIVGIAIAVIAVSLVVFLLPNSDNSNGELSWQEQYDLGVRYLSEGNYEEAIIAFTAAIEIEPKRAEAYISAADAYLNIGDFDQAEKILQEGYDVTNDETIADILKDYDSGSYNSYSGRRFRMNGYDENGVFAWYHIFTYDAEGRECAVTSFDVVGNQTGHVDYIYDAEGRLTTHYGWLAYTGEVFIIKREYNSRGSVIQEVWYHVDGTLEENTYDAQGRIKTKHIYSADSDLSRYYQYEYIGEEEWRLHYNADGTLTGYDVFTENRQEHYSVTGELLWYVIQIYDDNGNYLGSEHYDGQGNLTDFDRE